MFKNYAKYLHPIWIGFVMLASLRIVNDSISRKFFWTRPWTTSAAELLGSIAISYIIIFGIRYFIKRFNKEKFERSAQKQILKEVRIVAIYSLIVLNIFSLPIAMFTDDGLQWHDPLITNLVVMLILLLGFVYVRADYYIKALAGEKSRGEKLAKEKVEAELKFLKAQINPHSLFNAINGIYFLIEEDPEAAQKALEQLSGTLRYQLYECNSNRVFIKKEIDYLNNYIQIQRIRKSERLDIKLEFEKNWAGKKIAPFLLFPLVENAFKYVGGEEKIFIKASLLDSRFNFKIKNSCSNFKHKNEQGGIGLENIKKRLELIYPGRHQLLFSSDKNIFEVNLDISLDEI